MRFGDPILPKRFWRRVYIEPASGCWLWEGSTNEKGYGQIEFRSGPIRAKWYTHKLTYCASRELFLPRDHTWHVDHYMNCALECCNPDHLIHLSFTRHMRMTAMRRAV